MIDYSDFSVRETRHEAQCPHCVERLKFGQNGSEPRPDDPVTCHFHGVIGTRQEILRKVKNGDLLTVRYDVPKKRTGLNKWRYRPQPGDVTLLARIMFA